MQTFETPGGKTIQIKRSPKTAQFFIEFATGGELPEELTSTFSTEHNATMTVKMYLAKMDKKKPKLDKE